MKADINKYGQFFTDLDMSKWMIDIINSIKPLRNNILEPSFGSGNFLEHLTNYEEVFIDAVEIDTNHYKNYNNDFVSLYNQDFIYFEPNKKYDFIIGNPPYIELCYSFYSKTEQEVIKNTYKDISNGRINLVHIFMKRSFDLLNDDGVIAYLLPSSILTSPVYKKIRKIIYENFNVEFLMEDVNFKSVAIKVCLLILRKTANNGKYFFINNDNFYIMENYLKFNNNKTIKDYNFNVNIGEVVWNQKKDMLSSNPDDNILVYSYNIAEKNIQIFDDNGAKKQYIKNHTVRYENCIVFPRVISKKIKYAFIKNNQNFIFENHVLVVTNDNLSLLEKFYDNLESGMYNDLLLSFFNSSNLTKSELLSLPFD